VLDNLQLTLVIHMVPTVFSWFSSRRCVESCT